MGIFILARLLQLHLSSAFDVIEGLSAHRSGFSSLMTALILSPIVSAAFKPENKLPFI
jgi:hypothetical protein